MTMLVAVGPGSSRWAAEMRAALAGHPTTSGIDVVTMRDDLDPDTVEYVLMWDLAPDQLTAYPNLQAVMLMGAGYDHLDLAALPDVPIVRLTDPGMAADIALYALSWIIHFQRDFDRFAAAQVNGEWRDDLRPRFPGDVTVGVLGVGAIGGVVLDTCAAHGFGTIGWSRSHHDRPLIELFADSDIVVNVLPLTAHTRHLVGGSELHALGNGVLINVGRAGTVDTEALVGALDSGLRAAVLDVFDDEPLPADSGLWARPDVVVTPHIAGRSNPVTAAAVIAGNIERLRRGGVPEQVIHRG